LGVESEGASAAPSIILCIGGVEAALKINTMDKSLSLQRIGLKIPVVKV
jgi:hypothetical protein